MLSVLFTHSISLIEYQLTDKTLTISGEGEIDRNGIMSKGNIQKYHRVIINEGPSSIKEDTFSHCRELCYIYIPESVLTIGACFNGCCKLSEIVVNNNSKNYCTDHSILLTKDKKTLIRAPTVLNLFIPEGIEIIEKYAFSSGRLYNYGDIVIPSTIKTLNKNCFLESRFKSLSFATGTNLTCFNYFTYSSTNKLVIPKSVILIPDVACFQSEIYLLIFEKGSTLQKINKRSFSCLRTYNPVVLPDSITTIEENAFSESSLEIVEIGSCCSSIHNLAFNGCSDLKNIIIAENNPYFTKKNKILMNMEKTQILFIDLNVTKVTIETTIEIFGNTVFQKLENLTDISSIGSTKYSTLDGVVYNYDFSTLLAICGGVSSVTAHENVLTISDYAAKNCKKLNFFTFKANDTIKTIKMQAFFNSSIISFTLPYTVTGIGFRAFNSCSNLESFIIPENSQLLLFGACALQYTKIKTLFIPQNINILMYSLAHHCKSLTNITFHPNSKLESIQQWSFNNIQIEHIVFPASLIEICFESFCYCKNLKTIKFENKSKLTMIGYSAFCDCESLEEVELPDSIKTLDGKVFNNCKNLKTIKHSLTKIEERCFEYCVSLISFNFSSTQDYINPDVFLYCSNLVEFNIDPNNENFTCIDGCLYSKDETSLHLFPPGRERANISPKTLLFADNSFLRHEKLKSVIFHPNSKLEILGNNFLYECKKLTEFRFPENLKIIKEKCFYGCKSLKSIFIPSSVELIGSKAFIGCSSLRIAKYCGTNDMKGSDIFDNALIVFVTDLYPSATFCSMSIQRRLSLNCETKQQYIQKCKAAEKKICHNIYRQLLIMM